MLGSTVCRSPALRAARALGIAVVSAAVGLAGCRSGSDASRPVPVDGAVYYKGKPLVRGRVQFVPAHGRPALGEIVDGKFTLTTDREGDGALPGRYTVVVVATEPVPAEPGEGPGLRSLLPERFAKPETSSLTVEVPPEGAKGIEIQVPG
jgi:hypothetical protein